MALNAEIRDQAYQFFCQEAPEFLQQIEEGLLVLRQDQTTPNIHKIMRAAHSIKGGASSVELKGITEIAHKLEDIFRALYAWDQGIDRDMEELLLHAFDALRTPLIEQIEEGHYDEEAALTHALPIFETLEAYLGESLHNVDNALPTAAELGIDIALVVFSGDVQQGIDRLGAVLQDPEAELVGEIRAQAEVFAGIGQLLNLPGFTAIAYGVVAALDAQPRSAPEIGRVALENFRSAQATVLAGDRTQGGTPTAALLAFVQPRETGATINWMEEEEGFDDFPLTLPSDLFISTEEEITSIQEISYQPEIRSELEDALTPVAMADMFDDILLSPEEELSIFIPDTDQTSLPDMRDDLDIESDFGNWLGEDVDSVEDLSSIGNMFATAPIAEEESMGDWLSADFASLVAQEKEKHPESMDSQGLEVESIIQPSRSPLQPKTKREKKEIPAPMITEVIRVDLQRLERLNNLVGELVTQENGSQLQVQQLQTALQQLQGRFMVFERLTRNLQTWLDQSQKVQVRNASQFGNTEFDSLQMDYYSPLHSMIQEAVEEIAQMGEKVQDITLVTQQTTNIQRRKQQTLKQLRNDLLWARMIPLGDVLNRFPRMVRDLSLKYDKQVTVKLSGAGTLVDKQMLEKLNDPLIHLVRNAFDHGIEKNAQERIAAGKSAEATIEIRAYHRGNQTFIEVQDDGRGIHTEKVLEKAVQQGLVNAEEARALDTQQIYGLLFAPNFSTADKVSDLSGRGMGMSAVLNQVQSLKGTLLIDSELGKGTLFTIRLPLTLTITKLLVVQINGRLLAIPVDSLVSIISAPPEDIEKVWGREFYRYDRFLVPLYPVSLFANHYPLPLALDQIHGAMELPGEGKIPLLLLSLANRMVAVEVEQVLTEQELVIKPFSKAVTPPPYLYGCTILGDGSLVPVIDGTALISQWLETESRTVNVTATPVKSPKVSFDRPVIMVVDDSLTARQTLAITLSRSGYEVIQASDGREALEKLHDSPIKAVFCDVEMPVMNGFEFLTSCRKDYPADRLPVIMLTSRSSERHRGIAQLLGASGYLTKPFLEGDLLNTLKECLLAPSTVN